jgi:hypothetical protein
MYILNIQVIIFAKERKRKLQKKKQKKTPEMPKLKMILTSYD